MTQEEVAYRTAYEGWRRDPEGWWQEAAADLQWIKAPNRVFDGDVGPYGCWFPDASLNMSANCLDRHVEAGRGGETAIIWESPLAGASERISYQDLLDRTSRCAGMLLKRGVARGDRVLLYMPMIPEAIVAMLACARIGAIHSVVFGGFAARELAARIVDARPALTVTATCGLEPLRTIAYLPLVREALSLAGMQDMPCIVVDRPALPGVLQGSELDWYREMVAAPPAGCATMTATDPLYILYTSGTTGKPKGIVRDTGGYAVAVMRSMRMIYGIEAGDTVWTASDIGWVVGHSYIVYGPLLAGCTTLLYEGKPVGTPDAAAFWRLSARHRVAMLFTAPTAIRAIRREDPAGDGLRAHDLSALTSVFLAGERCDPSTADWLRQQLGRPVIDHWWQTETGWPITAGFREFGLVQFPQGSGGRAAPGWDVVSLDSDGRELPPGENGTLAVRLPLPPGAAPTLWHDDDGFQRAYLEEFPGFYTTGDAGNLTSVGDVQVMGRVDDVINVAGHRLSTGAMEEIVAAHPGVAECAVIGIHDALKGQVPFGLFVPTASHGTDVDALGAELVARVRERIGAIATPRAMVAVSRLPKTRSGKLLRRILRQIGDRAAYMIPPTIEDESALDEAKHAIERALTPTPPAQRET